MGAGKIFAILPLAGVVLILIGIWKLLEMIIIGALEGNWLMVIAGGILTYLVLGALIVVLILCVIFTFLILVDG